MIVVSFAPPSSFYPTHRRPWSSSSTRMYKSSLRILTGLLGVGASKMIGIWLLARLAGPSVQGAFTLAVSGMSAIAVVCAVGLDYANAVAVGQSRGVFRQVIHHSVTLALRTAPVAAFLAAVYLRLVPGASYGVEHGRGILLIALSLGATMMAMSQMLRAAFIGIADYKAISAANHVWSIVWLALVAAAAMGSYELVVFAWAAAFACSCGFYFLKVRSISHSTEQACRVGLFQEQLTFGAKTLVGSLARTLNMRAAVFVLAFFVPPSTIGVYGVILMIAEAFLYIPNAVSQVVLGASAASEYSDADRRKVTQSLMAAGILLAIILVLAGPWGLPTVFGAGYEAGVYPGAVLVLASTVHAIGLLELHESMGRGNPHVATNAQLLTLGLTVASCALLIPRLGMLGAALGTLIAYTAFALYLSHGRKVLQSAPPKTTGQETRRGEA